MAMENDVGKILENRCQWLKQACGAEWWAEFANGMGFFLKIHKGMDINSVVELLNSNKNMIAKAPEVLIGKLWYKEDTRELFTALAAAAVILGAAYSLDPRALISFITTECPKGLDDIRKTFKYGMGYYQLSPGSYAREIADKNSAWGKQATKQLNAEFEKRGLNVDLDALSGNDSEFRKSEFLGKNPFANMLGAVLTISLFGIYFKAGPNEMYLKPEREWPLMARRYNGSDRQEWYMEQYRNNFAVLCKELNFEGWRPEAKVAKR